MKGARLLLALGLLGAGCAPTTLGPSIIRTAPGPMGRSTALLGLRSGPRLGAVFSQTTTGPGTDREPFQFPHWSVAYDLGVTRRLSEAVALHAGAQGELYFPLPLPAYGLYAGLSRLDPVGPFRLAPAVCVKGASDFGLRSVAGPAHVAGVEGSLTVAAQPEPSVEVALVPFVSYQRVFSHRSGGAVYAGVAFAVRIQRVEVTAGVGRVFLEDGSSWSVPLVGLRGGE